MRRLALALVLLAACGAAENPPVVDKADEVQWTRIGIGNQVVRVNVDGVDCVVYSGMKTGGISCDWGQG